jgi:hypothetical protein
MLIFITNQTKITFNQQPRLKYEIVLYFFFLFFRQSICLQQPTLLYYDFTSMISLLLLYVHVHDVNYLTVN